MNIFKRIEVWVLLVVTAAGLVFVLLNRGGEESEYGERGTQTDPGTAPAGDDKVTPASSGGAISKFEKDGALEVNQVTVKRDFADYITEVTFSYDNQSDSEVRTIEEAKIVTESGKSIPVFFLAFTGAPPKLPAKERTDASLRFAIHHEDTVGSLTLDIRGERVPIKSARSFDPESIGNLESKTFKNLDWVRDHPRIT